jgi:hypothetical protein
MDAALEKTYRLRYRKAHIECDSAIVSSNHPVIFGPPVVSACAPGSRRCGL